MKNGMDVFDGRFDLLTTSLYTLSLRCVLRSDIRKPHNVAFNPVLLAETAETLPRIWTAEALSAPSPRLRKGFLQQDEAFCIL